MDESYVLMQRLDSTEPDWPCLQLLAQLWVAAFWAAPERADEACLGEAVRRFAGAMVAAGTCSAAASEQLAARLLEAGDGLARQEGPSLAFVLATTQLCGKAKYFELDFDGIGQLSYCPDTRVLTLPLMEVKIAPTKGALDASLYGCRC